MVRCWTSYVAILATSITSILISRDLYGKEPKGDVATTRVLHVEEERLVANSAAVRKSTYYLDGHGKRVRHGVSTYYDESSRRIMEDHYVDGVAHGESRRWWENGTLAEQFVFDHGEVIGTKRKWTHRGELLAEQERAGGKIIRNQGFFVQDAAASLPAECIGKMWWDEKYVDGQCVSYTQWHPNGNKAEEGPRRQFVEREGVQTYWDTKGQVIAQGIWRKGEPWSGVCRVREGIGSMQPWAFVQYAEGKPVQYAAGKPFTNDIETTFKPDRGRPPFSTARSLDE